MAVLAKNEELKKQYILDRVAQVVHHFRVFFAQNQRYDNMESQETKVLGSIYTKLEHTAFNTVAESFSNEGFFTKVIFHNDHKLATLEDAQLGKTRQYLIVSYEEITDHIVDVVLAHGDMGCGG